MAGNIKDFATGLVATAPSPATSGTTLTLQVGEGARMPAVPFYAVVHPATEMPTLDSAEKVQVTNVISNTLTIVRAQGGTTAKSIDIGWRLSNTLFESNIPVNLSDLTDDATHRLVSDTEKSTWNAKQAAMGTDDNYVTDAQLAALHPQVTGGTPALTLGTANTAGNAATFIRTNDTILAFDATALTAEAIASASSVGTATTAARRDHRHPMPTALAMLAGVGGGYAACATAIGTAAKTVALTGYSLVVGGTVGVTFTNGNSASAPTMNINSAGAKPIFNNGVAVANIPTGFTCLLMYDGTNYNIIDEGITTTTPSTQTYSDSAAIGTALDSARSDHKHAMPASTKDTTAQTGFLKGNGTTISGVATVTNPATSAPATPADGMLWWDTDDTAGAANGDADTVDGIHASATPTANQLLPLDSNAMIPDAALSTSGAGYVKIGNVLICTGTISFGSQSMASAYYTYFYRSAENLTFNYPVAFLTGTTPSFVAQATAATTWLVNSGGGSATTSPSMTFIGPANTTRTCTLQYTAIGLWR